MKLNALLEEGLRTIDKSTAIRKQRAIEQMSRTVDTDQLSAAHELRYV